MSRVRSTTCKILNLFCWLNKCLKHTRYFFVNSIELLRETSEGWYLHRHIYQVTPKESPPPPKEAKVLVDYCTRTGAPLILGCNANANSHTVWGSTNINQRGMALLMYHHRSTYSQGRKHTNLKGWSSKVGGFMTNPLYQTISSSALRLGSLNGIGTWGFLMWLSILRICQRNSRQFRCRSKELED